MYSDAIALLKSYIVSQEFRTDIIVRMSKSCNGNIYKWASFSNIIIKVGFVVYSISSLDITLLDIL